MAAHHAGARPDCAPIHDRVVQEDEAVGRAELERGLLVAGDLVADDVPGTARLWLKADAVGTALWMRLSDMRTFARPVSASTPSSDVSKMSLSQMSTLTYGYEIQPATLVMRLWAPCARSAVEAARRPSVAAAQARSSASLVRERNHQPRAARYHGRHRVEVAAVPRHGPADDDAVGGTKHDVAREVPVVVQP